MKKADIAEIFSSIQGEGLYIGCRQVFIRFSGCNLDCRYCDTDHKNRKNTFASRELLEEISKFDAVPYHSISLTGGEPLLYADFLKELLPGLNRTKIYLETNGTLPDELAKIASFTDIIAMDIKTESSTGYPMPGHAGFIRTAQTFNRELFAKVVVSKDITAGEIADIAELVGDNVPLVLQPLNNEGEVGWLTSVHDAFLKKIPNTRVIPQMHKFLGLR